MGLNTNLNYHAINLTGTQTLADLGDGVTASTVHEIYCIASGAIEITPILGDTFTFTATAGQSINVIPRQTITSSGTFIGFKSKFFPRQATGNRLR